MNTKFHDWFEEQCVEKRILRKGFVVHAKNAVPLVESLMNEVSPQELLDSTGLLGDRLPIRAGDFKLGDARGKRFPKDPEEGAQREIFEWYRTEQGQAELDEGSGGQYLSSIHSFQVPLAAKRVTGLGKIDLLGSSVERLPAVIELKVSGSMRNRSVGGLLGPIIQGLGYTLTIRHYWLHSEGFRREWVRREGSGCDLPDSLEKRDTPLVVAADRRFWEMPMQWMFCPWSRFREFAEYLQDAQIPLLAAKFESAEAPVLELAAFRELEGFSDGTNAVQWPC